ncbi:ABC transporter permease [Streptomyces sp. SL13]|uniref:Transport permease protein n=1 Tax=Streptantibioticus silvisoli TaxID=2705255 RepID=A0AA90H4M5_9ACTN|nr:ABC transporter permease [Streptantibioticus silvisoli]MDI5963005.1 ABC transporter permease [Streptantibioticus silvisoli]MDI5968720.1 ABC transporter permease [Streptantibioticus silvisoli]
MTVAVAPEPTAQDVLAAGGTLKSLRDTWVITKRNTLRMMRIPEALLLGMAQPVVFVLLFAYIFAGTFTVPGGGGSMAYREYMMPGFFAQTVAFVTAGNSSIGMANDIQRGMVDRFRSLPISRAALLNGRAAADIVQNCLVIVVMVICAVVVGWRIHRGLGHAILGFLLLLVLGYALSWVGVLIGMAVRTPEAAGSGNFLWLFPLTFLSNAFVTPSTLPAVLRFAAEWNPISATIQACRNQFGNPSLMQTHTFPMLHPALVSLLWSVGIAVICRTLAVRKYSSVGA